MNRRMIAVVALIVQSIGIIVIIIQLNLMKKQTHDNLEQSLREKTVEIMTTWSKTVQKETSFAEKIVEQFDEKQCELLYEQKDFQVSTEVKRELCQICPYKNTNTCTECKSNSSNLHTVSGLQLTELRWYIISYLNSLESVMIAWQQGIVDREIIEKQFLFLVDPTKKRNALANFRKVAGNGNSYPVIEKFCNILIEKQKQEVSTKQSLVSNNKKNSNH